MKERNNIKLAANVFYRISVSDYSAMKSRRKQLDNVIDNMLKHWKHGEFFFY